MDIDLSKLLNMPAEPTETHKNGNGGKDNTNTHNDNKNENEGISAEDTGIRKLQREIDQANGEKQQALLVYKEYQKNIMVSSELQSEIMKGLQAGEDIYTLFLKAMKIVSLTTSNTVQYNIAEQYIREIYGIGLGNPAPLEIELKQVKERLHRLEQSKENGMDYTQSIDRAIKSHQNKVKEIEELISKGKK